jgi:hypothetical protein
MGPLQRGEARAPRPGFTTSTAAAATRKISPSKDHPHQQDTAIVPGIRLVASGHSRFDRILVRRCVLCGNPHLHILFETAATAIERAPTCRRHSTYRVEIVDVLPSTPARRQRGAA